MLAIMRAYLELFTSFQGRIGRKSWWLGVVTLTFVTVAVALLIDPDLATPGAKPTLGLLTWQTVMLVPWLAVTIKRLNDRDHSHFVTYVWAATSLALTIAPRFGILSDPLSFSTVDWAISTLICLFYVWLVIETGFLKGIPGPNRYGPDPLDPTSGGTTAVAPSPVVAGAGRQRGAIARDIIVGTLALIAGLYLTVPGLSLKSTTEAVLRTITAWHMGPRWQLEQEMRANAPAWEAFNEGEAAAKQDKNTEAVAHYTRAIEHYGITNKTAGRVLMRRGRALRNLGRIQDALSDYSAAIAIDPNASAIRYSRRAHIYLGLKRYEDALSDYDQAIRLWPEYANYYLRRGDIFCKLGRFEQALADYDKSIVAVHEDLNQIERIRPHTGDFNSGESKRSRDRVWDAQIERRNKELGRAHLSRGLALRDLGRIDDALAAFDEAIRLNPEDIFAYRHRGWLYTRQGKLDLARADYERGLKISNNDKWLQEALEHLDSPDASVDALIHMANKLRDRKRYELALAIYNEAIEKRPDYAFALINRGWLYHLRDQLDAALSDYEKTIKLDPGYAGAYVYRGKAYEELNRLDKAAADFKQGIRLKPDYWRAYLWRGWLHHRQKQLDLAVADYTRAIELGPSVADAHLYRGHAYSDLRQFEKSLADYDKAHELSPEYVEVYKNRGWLYFKQDQWGSARADYERGLKLSPNDKWLQKALAQLEKRQSK